MPTRPSRPTSTEARFVARSTSHPDEIVARALVDARIAAPSVSRTTDALLRRLHERGDVVEEVVSDGDGLDGQHRQGRRHRTPTCAWPAGDGTGHPRRHAVGVFTSRPAAGAFARPRTNAPAFRQNDQVARAVLATLASLRPVPASPPGLTLSTASNGAA